jgi:hypothetical protein
MIVIPGIDEQADALVAVYGIPINDAVFRYLNAAGVVDRICPAFIDYIIDQRIVRGMFVANDPCAASVDRIVRNDIVIAHVQMNSPEAVIIHRVAFNRIISRTYEIDAHVVIMKSTFGYIEIRTALDADARLCCILEFETLY